MGTARPITGSGTTGEAALLEGRTFLGIEQSPRYADVARRRLTDVQAA
ncbi:DNA methyltransferase [Streptomyces shenzhenensis]